MALPRPLRGEIASIQRDIIHPLYVGGKIDPRDRTLIEQGGRNHRAWEVYEDISRDPHCFAILQKRYMAVVGREWEVKPASESRADKKAADMVRSHLEQLGGRADSQSVDEALVPAGGGFDQVSLDLLQAILYGLSPSEIIWDSDGKEIYPAEIVRKDLRRFSIVVPQEGRGYRLRLLTLNSPYEGEPLPPRKFITHRYSVGGLAEDPWGMGLGSRLFFPRFFKSNSVKFWLVFADKWATPTAMAKYSRSASQQQKDAALEMLNAIATDAGILVPEEIAIEFLEAQRSGSTNTYKGLANFCNTEMSKVVLGETGTTDQSNGGGSRARDEVGNEVRIEIAKGDSDLLSGTINRTLCRWITQLNVPGAMPPTVWRRFPELEEKFDRAGEAQIVVSLANAGYVPTQEWVAEKFDIELEKPDTSNPDGAPDLAGLMGGTPETPTDTPEPEATDAPADAPTPEPAALSEGEEETPIDRLTRDTVNRSQQVVGGWVDQIGEILQNSTSLEEAKDRLSFLYTGLSSDSLEESLGQALFLAELQGRYEVVQESEAAAGETETDAELAEAIDILRELDRAEAVDDLPYELSELSEAIAEFAAKKGGKGKSTKKKTAKPNCTPGKSFSCGYSCQSIKRNCRSPLPGQAANYAQWLAMQSGNSPTPTTTPAPTPAPAPAPATNPIKINQIDLDRTRNDLINRLGQKVVEDAENNVKRILDDADVFIRVGSADTLEKILGDRFKTAHELNVTSHRIPDLRDRNYLTARARVEEKTMGVPSGTAAGDRPIYAYLGNGKDLSGRSHADPTRAYGSIAVKLKPEVKDRATFTGADSFKSGFASQIKNDGTPPPPNAASLIPATRHGYDRDNLPRHYPSYYSSDVSDGGMVRAAARAKSIDDLTPSLNLTGNAYIEAQVYGKVTAKDIAEIHFSPRGLDDRPNAAIAQFARDSGVDLYVRGKKLSAQDLNDLINPPQQQQATPTTRPARIQALSDALDRGVKSGDFSDLAILAEDVKRRASQRKDASPDSISRQIFEDAGFDGLPRVAAESDVTQAWQGGGLLMIRGMSGGGGLAQQKFNDLKQGDYYVASSNIYGAGIYTAHAGTSGKRVNDPADLKGYTSAPTRDAQSAWKSLTQRTSYINSTTINARMVLDADATIATHRQAKKDYLEVSRAIDNWERAQIRNGGDYRTVRAQSDAIREVFLRDPNGSGSLSARLAAIRGYDGIILNESYEPERFFNVLNRSKLTIQDRAISYSAGVKGVMGA